MQTVVEAITTLGQKIDLKTQTSWGPIWAAMGVCVAMLGLLGTVVYAPIKDSQSRVEESLAALNAKI